jgi:hypothetical protein
MLAQATRQGVGQMNKLEKKSPNRSRGFQGLRLLLNVAMYAHPPMMMKVALLRKRPDASNGLQVKLRRHH